MPKEKMLYLISKIPPSVNHYLGYRSIHKGKKSFVVAYTTKEAKEYKSYFQNIARKEIEKQEWHIEWTKNNHCYMDCIFYFPRRDMDEQNYYKVLSDCLNGIAYIDDSGILTRTHRIYYDKNNPHIEITIYPVPYIGIFKNQNELDQFEHKCQTCKRYKRNCSILKHAKEGFIQNEINEQYICSKYNKRVDISDGHD